MHKVVKSYTLQFSVQEGTINPKYQPDFEDCFEHVEESIQDDLWRKMMATGHCDEWESCDHDDFYITVQVDVDKDIDKVIAELLEATMSDPDYDAVRESVRSRMGRRIDDIIWDEEANRKRHEHLNEQEIILFRSEEPDEDEEN